MMRKPYLFLLLALIALVFSTPALAEQAPASATATASATAAPDTAPAAATVDDEAEIDFAALVGTPEALNVCTPGNNCSGCSTEYFACQCACNQTAIACENSCGGVPQCIFQCELAYQDCDNECACGIFC